MAVSLIYFWLSLRADLRLPITGRRITLSMDNAASVGKGGREHLPFRPESLSQPVVRGRCPGQCTWLPTRAPTNGLLQEFSKVFRKFSEFLEPGYDDARKGSYASSADTGWLQQALYGKNVLRTKASPHFGRRVI